MFLSARIVVTALLGSHNLEHNLRIEINVPYGKNFRGEIFSFFSVILDNYEIKFPRD